MVRSGRLPGSRIPRPAAALLMKLFDLPFLVSLVEQFRHSMKGLLLDLCDELDQRYPNAARRVKLPVDLIRLVGRAMPLHSYAHWRFVGWIETLNDLVYFIDLCEQAEREGRDLEFVEQLYTECQQTWYEHSYAEELFPDGAVPDGRLPARLDRLCRHLARDVAQQSLLWEPALTCEWIRDTGRRSWHTDCDLTPNFDRADPSYALSVGVNEVLYHAPRPVREELPSSAGGAGLIATGRSISVAARGSRSLFYTAAPHEQWHWRRQDPVVLRRSALGTLTVGPTLVYGHQRGPTGIVATTPAVADNMRRALRVIEQAWPAGNDILALLTSRIVPLKARGVVSFSYRHQPGLSFINCFDRDALDLIDDLIHENSHHHLNLLLRKYVLYGGDDNREVFYSPWRRTLRPIRGILHASFTFAMGACLFERLSAWGRGPAGNRRWRQAGLSRIDLDRARFRGLEEIESVRYSLRDLRDARRRFGWITKGGGLLVALLARTVSRIRRRMNRSVVMRSPYRVDLGRHVEELKAARTQHGPIASRSR
jgi:HEXXH motif-containing protein